MRRPHGAIALLVFGSSMPNRRAALFDVTAVPCLVPCCCARNARQILIYGCGTGSAVICRQAYIARALAHSLFAMTAQENIGQAACGHPVSTGGFYCRRSSLQLRALLCKGVRWVMASRMCILRLHSPGSYRVIFLKKQPVAQR